MKFINTKTKQYPLYNVSSNYANAKKVAAKSENHLQLKDRPTVEPIYAVVETTTKPIVDYTKNVVEGPPIETDGIWNQVWNIVDASVEEIAARTLAEATKVRTIRDAKLIASDWTQLKDSPADKILWATYRQSLRDLTAEVGFPWSLVWPLAPGETPSVETSVETKVTTDLIKPTITNVKTASNALKAVNQLKDIKIPAWKQTP